MHFHRLSSTSSKMYRHTSKRNTSVYRLNTNLVIVFVLYYTANVLETTECHSIAQESVPPYSSRATSDQEASHHSAKLHATTSTQNNIRWLVVSRQSGQRVLESPSTQLDEPPVASSDEHSNNHHHHLDQIQDNSTKTDHHHGQQQQQQQLKLPTVSTANPLEKIISADTPTTIGSLSQLVSEPLSQSDHSATTASTTTTTSTTTSTTIQSPASSWIESILINVEVMNLLNERRRAKLASNDESNENRGHHAIDYHDDREFVGAATVAKPSSEPTGDEGEGDSASSQAPTDSGEDLLDSLVDMTTTAASTTSTIVSSSSNNITSGGHQLHQMSTSSPVQTQIDMNDEQKLVESNNVSAVVSHPMSSHQAIANNDAIVTTNHSKQPISCEQAYTQCALREVCAPTLKAYNDDCQDLIQNRTNQCSNKCLKAMIALRSSETGDDFANCDCQNNEFCLKSKQRSQICQPEVDKAIEPKSIVSCSVASWICMADQLCSTALGYYYRNCQSLFSQRHCSDSCNNSLAILYRQPKAMKLINCQCDGSEEFPCVRYKTYTERLCLNKHLTSSTPTTFNANNDASLQTDAAASLSLSVGEDDSSLPTNEDDGLNLTNEPADVPPLMHSGEDYESEYNDAAPGFGSDDGEPSSTISKNFYDGIQQPAIEDNWIPLVSGRYFTNLHQQQQRRQQQQQQHKVKQQQQKSPKPTTRRTQKNSKQQKIKSNEPKRRHSRPYMFALTSSTTPSAMHNLISHHFWMANLGPTLLVSIVMIALL